MKVFENLDINDLEGEIWKVIKDFPDYYVSNFGRIKSLKYGKERILKQCKYNNDYFRVGLWKNGTSKLKKVHRLVYEVHKEKLEEGCDAHHINGDGKNNFVNNLESKPHSKHTGDHHKGKMISEETKNKMSEKKIGIYIGKNNPNFGKHHLEETKIKISDNRKGKCVRENNPNFRITNQKIIDIKIDIERGDLTHKQIAKKNNVGTVTVSKIKTGKIIIK